MKILTISDSPNLFSGLARVHRNVIDAFAEKGHQVLPCVWFGYDNDTLQLIQSKKITPPPIFYQSGEQKIQMLSLYKRKRDSDIAALYEIIKTCKPDVVCTIGDYWDFYYMQALKVKSDFKFKWLAYLTIETDQIDEKMKPLFRYADVIAVPTRFGKNVLEAETDKPIKVVSYGVDETFSRKSDEDRKVLREARDCDDKIRFITVAQNTSRKSLPLLMQAVRLICHRDPDRRMQFYVHSNLDGIDRQESSLFDLRSIARKLGVEDWFVFPEDCTSLFSAPSDSFLCDEYNSADFFITPSICEGYGLPIVEAMACGLPVIANAFSCMPDHLGAMAGEGPFGRAERGWAVANRTEVIPPDFLIKVVRPEGLGQAIWEMVQLKGDQKGREILHSMSQNCMRYAKERTWDGMKRGICEVFDEVAGPVALPVEVIG